MILRKVTRLKDEGRLPLILRTTRKCHRLFALPGDSGREDASGT